MGQEAQKRNEEGVQAQERMGRLTEDMKTGAGYCGAAKGGKRLRMDAENE